MDVILSLSFLEEILLNNSLRNDKYCKLLQEEGEEENHQHLPFSVIASKAIFGSILLHLAGYILYTVTSFTDDTHLHPRYTRKIREITNDNKIEVYVDTSKAINAYYAGGRKLYITRGMISFLNNDDEVMACLLHEYGHKIKRHLLKQYLFSMGNMSVAIMIMMSVSHALTGLGLGLLTKRLLSVLFDITIGRRHEYQADAMTKKYGYDKHLIRAFLKIDKYVRKRICMDMNQRQCEARIRELHRWDEHPTFIQRIRALLQSTALRFVKAFGGVLGLRLAAKYFMKLSEIISKYPAKLTRLLSFDGG